MVTVVYDPAFNKKERAGMGNGKNSTESTVPDTDTYLQSLMVTNPLQEPIFRSAIHALDLPQESRGLDVGCGIGLQALLLAEVVGPAGHVTGVDLSPEFLVYARSIAEKAGIPEQVSFQEGDMNNLQFDDDTFDWVWSANCAGYAPGQPLPQLMELARVVNAGRKFDHPCMVFSTTAPRLSLTGGTSECDIFRYRPVC